MYQATLKVVLALSLVEKTKETVIMIAIAREITSAELTIAEALLVLHHFMIVAIVQKRMVAQFKFLVEIIKVIVILMENVWMDLSAD